MPTTEAHIYQAEANRVKGRLPDALLQARQDGPVPTTTISTLSKRDLENQMRIWRIWVTTVGGLASRAWNGNNAAAFLHESKDVIEQYYRHPVVETAATAMQQDAENHPYEMAPEMAGDEANHMIKLATLTGNTQHLQTAVSLLEDGIGIAKEKGSAQSLLLMRLWLAEQKLDPEQVKFSEMAAYYDQISRISSEIENWDRLAATSWMYAKAARSQHNEQAYQLALKNLNLASNKVGVDLHQANRKKDLVGKVIAAVQRVTYHGDGNELALK